MSKVTVTVEIADGYSAKQVASWLRSILFNKRWIGRVTVRQNGRPDCEMDVRPEWTVIDLYGTERFKWTDTTTLDA